ncbi:MAG TPA: hypothetical protein VFU49_00770 [Ktedonobacteraceae bacterium]|nr:hypothetical protein [Ktedonobacteraceae bacterium]
MESKFQRLNRRQLLKAGLISASTLGMLEGLTWKPMRVAQAAPLANLPEIQFDLGAFIAPAKTLNDGGGNVLVQFGPIFTLFLTMQLTRFPSLTDSQTWHDALERIESVYPFSPSGVFTIVSYGLPYFNRLPSSLVSSNMPRLLSNNSRFALEEAVPSPTDVSSSNPGISKQTFNVPVKIENNDVLVTLRSDSLTNLNDVVAWLQGSNSLNGFSLPSPAFNGLFRFTSTRVQFTQVGMPRKVADANHLSFASRVNPDSPMWMGFLDQQVNGSGPASICTFQGNSSAVFTNTTSGNYFFNGAIQHLSHVIEDLPQFYSDAEPFTERVQYMFRSDPIPSLGNADQFNNGGGPAVLANDASVFLHYKSQGTTEAIQTAKDPNTANDPQPDGSGRIPRMGHLSALQISSRAKDGTPVHIRMDGPGFDNMDVPDGSNQAKLQFTVFVPTADFFTTMRKNQAALNFQIAEAGFGGSPNGTVDSEDNGLERFLIATRRQNFLVPPRSRRTFPLREFLP